MIPVVEAFEDVVNKVNDKILLPQNCNVNYKYGHLLSIDNELVNDGEVIETAVNKYPLIALLQPFPEKTDDVDYIVDLRLIICTSTDSDILTKSRYKRTFQPILYLIYEELMKQIKRSVYFSWSGSQVRPPHTKIDRPYIGVGTDNKRLKYMMSDNLDAIEITNLNLKYTNKKC